jgi:hypothetical protein
MSGDFFDPTPDEQVVVLVQSATLRQAERLIESCEHCNEEDAQIPFDNIYGLCSGRTGKVSELPTADSRKGAG